MGRFAWRNLLTRPLRTMLALIGLSIPVLGVMGLFSLSGGLRDMVGDTLSRVEGMMVLRENSPSPVFSQLPTDLGPKLKAMPGVRVVAAEVWGIAPNIEGRSMLTGLATKGAASLLDQPVILGQDAEGHAKMHSAVYPKALKEKGEGRFLDVSDQGTNHIVISRKIARDFPGRDGKPRKVGDTITIGGRAFQVIGLYDAGSMLIDVVIVMDIATAREVLKFAPEQVSSYYIESRDITKNDATAAAIKATFPGVDAKNMSEFMGTFTSLMGQLDTFLLMTVSLALLVGVVGIVNTMLMSTSERFVEFGVLRTNGWSQGDVLKLVTLESAYLGLLSGLVGAVLAVTGVTVANLFISGGVRLTMPPWLLALGIGLSVVTGTLGGLYPAWRAARLVPMDAIRVGSH
jgi:putative ABC transport system permease protein